MESVHDGYNNQITDVNKHLHHKIDSISRGKIPCKAQ